MQDKTKRFPSMHNEKTIVRLLFDRNLSEAAKITYCRLFFCKITGEIRIDVERLCEARKIHKKSIAKHLRFLDKAGYVKRRIKIENKKRITYIQLLD